MIKSYMLFLLGMTYFVVTLPPPGAACVMRMVPGMPVEASLKPGRADTDPAKQAVEITPSIPWAYDISRDHGGCLSQASVYPRQVHPDLFAPSTSGNPAPASHPHLYPAAQSAAIVLLGSGLIGLSGFIRRPVPSPLNNRDLKRSADGILTRANTAGDQSPVYVASGEECTLNHLGPHLRPLATEREFMGRPRGI